MISISIVSHRQVAMLEPLLRDLQLCTNVCFELIITHNVTERELKVDSNMRTPVVIRNAVPKGFGANHNAAFSVSSGDFFCVLNPDIRISSDPFPELLELAAQDGVGVVAPSIVTPAGILEDSARMFPAPFELLCKALGGESAVHSGYGSVLEPDWIAGMFLLFPRKIFEEMGGFDERYFLYYEDVDLCARLALKGYKRLVCTEIQAVHDARRTSRRKLRYALMHLRSIFRFFTSDVYCQLRKKLPQ